jgi:lysophospholipase L1-like esterase
MRRVMLVLGLIACAILVYDALIFGRAVLRSRAVSAEGVAFQQAPQRVSARLLVVGDSTGVGTGAETPAQSIAGRIGRDFPGALIENRTVNGALTAAIDRQIKNADRARYDAVLIQVGGNDALRFTSRGQLETAIRDAIREAGTRTARVALMSTGDLGDAPAIPWPLSHLFRARAAMVRDLFAQVARELGCNYVDLWQPAGAPNPFKREPDRYYARDGLHPSGHGYAAWYAILREQVPLHEWLDASGHNAAPQPPA